MLRLFARALLFLALSLGIATGQGSECNNAIVESRAALLAFLGVHNRFGPETCYEGLTRDVDRLAAAEQRVKASNEQLQRSCRTAPALEGSSEPSKMLRKQQERLRGCERRRTSVPACRDLS